MPHILITNDDGYQSPGLMALAHSFARLGRVTVFAPDHNWSAAGHTKTMHKPLRIIESTLPGGMPLYVTTGTPSDCVGLALLGVLPERPDLVVSGINMGSNLGHDVTYSGTLAAAMEAVVYGVPAIAASHDLAEGFEPDMPFAAEVTALIGQAVLAHGLPENALLSVNLPALRGAEMRGLAITRLGRRVYRDVLIQRADPRGQPYYWIGGDPPAGDPEDGTDIGALTEGFVSVTPLNLDMTDHGLLPVVTGWGLNLGALYNA